MANLGYYVQATASASAYIQSLNNDYLQSQNGDYFATMQIDGNFCVYSGAPPANPNWPVGSTSVWCAGSNQKCMCFFFAAMQSDGNFCVYSGAPGSVLGNGLWCSGSGGNPSGNFYLILENDGDLNVYQGTPTSPGHLMWSSDADVAAAAREALRGSEASPSPAPS